MAAFDIVIGCALALTGLFALSAAHKVVAVARGAAAAQPLLQQGMLSRAPRLFLGVALALEVCVVALMWIHPAIGLGSAGALLVLYVGRLRTLDPATPCHCFGTTSRTRSRTAVGRNLALALLAAFSALVALVARHDSEPANAVAVAVLILSAVVALEAVERLPVTSLESEAR